MKCWLSSVIKVDIYLINPSVDTIIDEYIFDKDVFVSLQIMCIVDT